MRPAFSPTLAVCLAFACSHCGSAYVGMSTGSTDSSTGTGAAGSTTTAGSATTGETPGTTTTGGTGPLTLTLNGQTFRGLGGAIAYAQLITDVGVKTGAVTDTTVDNNGMFFITLSRMLDPGVSYNVAIFVDSNENNRCDTRDEQWLLPVPVSSSDVTLQTGRPVINQNVCGIF